MTVRRNTPKYRVLVELAGQHRPLTLQELYEATSLAPETLREATAALVFAYYVDIAFYIGDTWIEDGVYKITWEGEELLRRLDTEGTRPMRAVTKPKKRWWRR
jgi:hypothetical protein